MTRPRQQQRQQPQRGFTLVELLLVVTIVLLLVGAVVFNFSSLLRGNQLQEGTTRLETLLRFARAQAANSGHRVQLVFSAESTNTAAASTGEVRATWEPDPLKQPGCFTDLTEAHWQVQDLNDLVQIESVKLLEQVTTSPATLVCPEEDAVEESGSTLTKQLAPITFYPDGSSDSAEIILAARSEEDQRMAVRLVGLTGNISRQLLSLDLDEMVADAGASDQTAAAPRGGFARDPDLDGEPTSRLPSGAPLASVPGAVAAAPRATVGETNSLDKGE